MSTPGVFSLAWFLVKLGMAIILLWVAFLFLSTIFWAGVVGIGGH